MTSSLVALIALLALLEPTHALSNRKLLACAAGDAQCFCSGRTGVFADTSTNCANYYECVSSTQNYYRSCPTGLVFDQTLLQCNWPSAVTCSGGSTSPSPVPSPSPKASPPPSPVVNSPPPPSPSPSPKASPPPSPVVNSPPPPASPTQSPSISPSPSSPCASGDSACFCKWKQATGMFADTATGCQKYYWCVSSTQTYYQSCASGLLFNDQLQYCDWAANVKCTATSPSPVPSPPPKAPSPPVSPPPPPQPSPPPSPPSPPGSNYKYVVYYQSWSDPWSSSAATSSLTKLPSYANVVILSFMQPDTTYTASSGISFAGTGLQFSSDPSVIKDSIAALKQKNPNTKVLIAVGGATFTNFQNINAAGIAAFVKNFGLDGVDLDYEPTNANCRTGSTGLVCDTDTEYINTVKALRQALPRPYLLSTAAWSIGAYGEGAYANAQPAGQYTGVAINMLKTVGNQLDFLNVMSYDAGPTYDPKQALNAYKSYFSGPVMMGVEVAPEAWGGHVITMTEVNSLGDYVKQVGGGGMMLWSVQKTASAGTPTADDISKAVCTKLGLTNCNCGLSSC